MHHAAGVGFVAMSDMGTGVGSVVSSVTHATFSTAFVGRGHTSQCPHYSGEYYKDVDEEKAGRDESILDQAVVEPVCDCLDSTRDLIRSDARRGCKERVKIRVTIDRVLCAHAECVVVKEWEVDLGVVVHPCEALLHTLDLDTDDAVQHSLDGVEEDGALESSVEAIIHSLEEGVESVVDGVRSVSDVAENVVVDVVVEALDDTVGASGPVVGNALQALHHVVGKGANLVSQSRDFVSNGPEEEVAAEAREEARDREGQDEQGRHRGGVGDAPAHQDLLLALEARGDLYSPRRGHGARGDVDNIHGVELVLSNETGMLLLSSPALDLEPGHGDDGGHGQEDKDDDEDDLGLGDELKQVGEEFIESIILGAKGQLLLLGQGECIPIELVAAVSFVEGLADKVERLCNGLFGQVLDLSEVGKILFELANVRDKVCGVEVKVLEVFDGLGEVDLGDVGDQIAKDGVLNTLSNLINAIFEGSSNVFDFLGHLVDDLVERLGGILGDISHDIKTTVNHGCDEADVSGSEEVDVEDDEVLDADDDEVEHVHHGVDGLFDSRSCKLVDTS